MFHIHTKYQEEVSALTHSVLHSVETLTDLLCLEGSFHTLLFCHWHDMVSTQTEPIHSAGTRLVRVERFSVRMYATATFAGCC
jgi:hypothetical protein